MPDWTIYVRDVDRNRVAQVDDFGSLDLTLRFNEVDLWELELPSDGGPASLLDFSAGIVVVRDGITVLSGPVTRRERRWATNSNTLVVSGPDDTVHLRRRLGYPVPAGPPYTSSAYDVRIGVAETIMREYVDVNVGASATSPRRVGGLTAGSTAGLGSSVTGRARFQLLIDLLRELALAGGDLGFRVVQDGTDLEFDVYQPTDRTASVIFSAELGNLRAFSYVAEAAEANYVIAAGGGEGTARTLVEGGDSASQSRYGRIEEFLDQRQTTDTTELTQARDERLAETAERTSLSLTPIDTDAVAYGTSYGLGDRVTVVVDGIAISDVVREVNLTLDGDGETVTPTVGTPGVSDPTRVLALFDLFRRSSRQIRNLERR